MLNNPVTIRNNVAIETMHRQKHRHGQPVSKEFLFDRMLDAVENKHKTRAKNLVKQLGESSE
jgi:hypothetical protein